MLRNLSFSLKDNREQSPLTEEPPRSGDIEFIERYCRNWQENAHTYEETLPDLRKAAQRLLQVLERPDSFCGISEDELRRMQDVEPEIACLARQPLYFTEMFLWRFPAIWRRVRAVERE